MMKRILIALSVLMVGLTVQAAPKVGAKAPDFSVKDLQGQTRDLGSFAGKKIILEWYNKDCPYVRKHYDTGNMQKLQEELTGKGWIWLTVLSSNKGKQGHQSVADALANAQKEKSKATAQLFDEDGKMGRAYDAKVTPHMYIIDEQGILKYNGAIDSNSSANPKTIESAENYVRSAVASLEKGEAIQKTTTKPYGCTVKY